MARFSLGIEDDSEGPSSPRPKKQRITRTTQQQEHQYHHHNEQVVEEEVDSEYQEEDDNEEEDIESEYQEEEEEKEEEEEEEEDEEEDQNEDERGANEVSIGGGQGDDLGTAGQSGDGPISVTLTDPDVLDCPICLEPLSIPVFQCENGHLACSSCCVKIGYKCPSCSWPIGYNRCRAIEKVLESVKVSCQHSKYGCKATVSYSMKHEHEETCIYTPCSCPLPDCNFMGSSKHLYLHFSSKHSNSATRFCYDCLCPVSLEVNQKYIILQEETDGVIFILNNAIELLGNVINVICIGPSSSKRGFLYDLLARNGGTFVKLQSFTKSIPRWVEYPPQKGFLLVPSDFFGSRGQLKLEVCIWRRDHEFSAHIQGGDNVV